MARALVKNSGVASTADHRVSTRKAEHAGREPQMNLDRLRRRPDRMTLP
jgi:hypothetical protein